MKNVAIIIGHRPGKQGAYSPVLNQTEYEFNKKVASYLEDIADVYERPYIPLVPESFMINQLVKEVNKHDYDLVISLHFNAFTDPDVHGATALYYITNRFSKVIAKEFVQMMADNFCIKKRELIAIRSKKQRGGTLILGLKAPSVIVEPFFGSNDYDSQQFYNQEEGYAELLKSLIAVTKHLKFYNT